MSIWLFLNDMVDNLWLQNCSTFFLDFFDALLYFWAHFGCVSSPFAMNDEKHVF